jgi:hypothetical protein
MRKKMYPCQFMQKKYLHRACITALLQNYFLSRAQNTRAALPKAFLGLGDSSVRNFLIHLQCCTVIMDKTL